MTNSEAGPPPVPPDCDLRDFAFMPLDVRRLRDSDLSGAASGDEFRAAVLLWCAAWHQVPAASLPADDGTLAMLAGYGRDVAAWRAVKDGALRGFRLASDGRLYHDTIAEKALEATARRRRQSQGGRAAMAHRWHHTQPTSPPASPTPDEKPQPVAPQDSDKLLISTLQHRQGQGHRQRHNTTPPIPPVAHSGNCVDGFDKFWIAYPRKIGKGAARKAWAKATGKRPPLSDMIAAIERQRKSDQWTRDGGQYIPHPATWLNQERWSDVVETAGGATASRRQPALNNTWLDPNPDPGKLAAF